MLSGHSDSPDGVCLTSTQPNHRVIYPQSNAAPPGLHACARLRVCVCVCSPMTETSYSIRSRASWPLCISTVRASACFSLLKGIPSTLSTRSPALRVPSLQRDGRKRTFHEIRPTVPREVRRRCAFDGECRRSGALSCSGDHGDHQCTADLEARKYVHRTGTPAKAPSSAIETLNACDLLVPPDPTCPPDLRAARTSPPEDETGASPRGNLLKKTGQPTTLTSAEKKKSPKRS